MADIKVLDDGPLQVSGDFTLFDGLGNKMETKNQIFLCRCGLSSTKPYCNGAHKGELDSKVRA